MHNIQSPVVVVVVCCSGRSFIRSLACLLQPNDVHHLLRCRTGYKFYFSLLSSPHRCVVVVAVITSFSFEIFAISHTRTSWLQCLDNKARFCVATSKSSVYTWLITYETIKWLNVCEIVCSSSRPAAAVAAVAVVAECIIDSYTNSAFFFFYSMQLV